MATIFGFLRAVEQRPFMYLGGDRVDNDLLRRLELVILGYEYALCQHDIKEPGMDFLRAFAEYLRRTGGTRSWSMSCGVIAAVIEHSESETAAWDKFWHLLWTFQRECFPALG